MSEEWLGVFPTVVTSVITTVATMAVVATGGALKAKMSKKSHPLLLRRDREQWSVRNVTGNALRGASAYVQNSASEQRIIDFNQDSIEPSVSVFVGALKDGDVFVAQWTERDWRGRRLQFSAQAHLRSDSLEFKLQRELESRFT